ncbi:MAG: TIGR02206 family membrane protein [Lachnospiraceae bacterium]|nr:TIGR02206 family membrane protein [Lachnospiraceae bacterium]
MDLFQYLFYSADNIPDGVGFSLFSVGHLAWLTAIVVGIALVCRQYRQADEAGRTKMRRVVSALMIADECLKIGVLSAIGYYDASYLPLHLCSINIFVCLWYTLRPNKMAAEVLYALSIPGALVALCSPTWVELPFVNLMSFHSFSVHGLLILYPMMLLTSGEHRPSIRRVWMPLVFMLVLSPILYVFNTMFDTNFMFLNGTADNIVLETIESIVTPRFYILGLVTLVMIVWFFMYLPWTIMDRKKRTVIETEAKKAS